MTRRNMFGILQTEPIDFVLTQLRIFTLFFYFHESESSYAPIRSNFMGFSKSM